LKRTISCAAAGIAAALVLAVPAGAADWTAGAPTSGDPFFPQMGNGGYDVQHYSLDLDYDPATQVLDGSARITLVPTQDLDQFNLDLRDWFGVSRVAVGKHPAAYFQEDDQELVITPRPKLHSGRTYTVEVDYLGVPETVVDPDDSFEGWVKNPDGAFVVNEPQGSPGWFPVNDDPNDKATYDFAITVPEGNVAIGNGRLLSSVTDGGRTTWRWREDSPMASYLTTATNGDFVLTIQTGPNGLPIYDAVDSKGDSLATNGFSAAQKTTIAGHIAAEPQIIQVLTELWGPYPFTSAGGVYDRGGVGYHLESQTKPMYDGVPSRTTVVHELAHQWFGNSVTLSVWRDIWLNEGFARFSEWMYNERTGGQTAQQQFLATANYGTAATSSNWNIPPALIPGAANLFVPSFPSYNRGAMTLQALRVKIGDAVFFPMMRKWYADNRDSNVTTEQFIALAESASGQQLDAFFDVWLYQPGKPTSW
jgi:aminopeptidase N